MAKKLHDCCFRHFYIVEIHTLKIMKKKQLILVQNILLRVTNANKNSTKTTWIDPVLVSLLLALNRYNTIFSKYMQYNTIFSKYMQVWRSITWLSMFATLKYTCEIMFSVAFYLISLSSPMHINTRYALLKFQHRLLLELV